MANVKHWGIIDGFRLARTVGKELASPARYTTQEFIAAAECALLKHPNEWVIYYILGDKYHEMGYYANGLKATQKCVEIRPTDIRSSYALATSYNILTRAAWSDIEDQAAKIYRLLLPQFSIDIFDKKYSQAGLDHTGLAVETAATQSMRWFERALELNPDKESQIHIEESLSVLFMRFPHLRR